MSEHVQSWIDGYVAIREHAYQSRGFVELDDGNRWPRTTGNDVIAIAAIADGPVRQHGTAGMLRRWRAACEDLQRDATSSPHDTYPHNRSFWASLESLVFYLDDAAVPPPPSSIWDALVAELAAPRNAGPTVDGPIAHFDNIKTYDDLYNAQLLFLMQKRGTDSRDEPAGYGGGVRKIPRTTNADVLQLATYWSDELAKVKKVFGHDGIVARWTPVVADVDSLAKPGKPEDVYPKNNEFWRVVQQVAIQIAVADEAPSKWDMIVDSVKDSVVHLPENLGAAAHKGADLIETAAHGVGKAVNEVGKGLLSGLGTPVLAVGAGLVGLFLLTRHHEEP